MVQIDLYKIESNQDFWKSWRLIMLHSLIKIIVSCLIYKEATIWKKIKLHVHLKHHLKKSFFFAKKSVRFFLFLSSNRFLLWCNLKQHQCSSVCSIFLKVGTVSRWPIHYALVLHYHFLCLFLIVFLSLGFFYICVYLPICLCVYFSFFEGFFLGIS